MNVNRNKPVSAVTQVALNMLESDLGELAYFGDTSYKYLILFIKDNFKCNPTRVSFDKNKKTITVDVSISIHNYLLTMIKLKLKKKLTSFEAFLGLKDYRLVLRRDGSGKTNGKVAL